MKWYLLGLGMVTQIFNTRDEGVKYWNSHSGYDVLVPVPTV